MESKQLFRETKYKRLMRKASIFTHSPHGVKMKFIVPVGNLKRKEVDKLISQVLNPKPKVSFFKKLIRTFVK
jgi:hypothetical protein